MSLSQRSFIANVNKTSDCHPEYAVVCVGCLTVRCGRLSLYSSVLHSLAVFCAAPRLTCVGSLLTSVTFSYFESTECSESPHVLNRGQRVVLFSAGYWCLRSTASLALCEDLLYCIVDILYGLCTPISFLFTLR